MRGLDSIVALLQGAGTGADSSHQQKAETERCTESVAKLLKLQSLPRTTHLFQNGHTSQSFPNDSINWGLCLHLYDVIKSIPFRLQHTFTWEWLAGHHHSSHTCNEMNWTERTVSQKVTLYSRMRSHQITWCRRG